MIGKIALAALVGTLTTTALASPASAYEHCGVERRVERRGERRGERERHERDWRREASRYRRW